MTQPKKRFIAGAVCPKCAQMDVLVVYSIGSHEHRECVECGFEDRIQFKPEFRELTTRVNTPEKRLESETQVVTIIAPSNKTE